jgi:hypothetical protein
LSNAETLTGDFTVTAGTVNALTHNLLVAGDWSNGGTYNAGSGAVTLNGTGQTINGSTTFFGLTKSTATADTLTFASGTTTTVNSGGALSLTGASGQLLTLAPSGAGDWLLDVTGGAGQTISFVDASQSDASAGATILATDGSNTNGGGNTNWQFTVASVAGTVYSDEGITALGSQTVRLAVNGTDISTVESNVTTGVYSFTGLSLNPGDVLTLYLEDEPADAVTVTVSNGGNLTGVDLYQDYLITRHDNGGALTNVNLATAIVATEDDI